MILRLKLAVSLASCFLLLALVLPAPAQRKGEIVSINPSSAPYRVGERLTYTVSFSNFISAAHVEFQVVNRGTFFGREGIQLRSHIQTTGVVNVALFAINNDYITYVDPKTGLPFRSQQVVRQASRASDTSNDFNQPAGMPAIPSELSTAPPLVLTTSCRQSIGCARYRSAKDPRIAFPCGSITPIIRRN